MKFLLCESDDGLHIIGKPFTTKTGEEREIVRAMRRDTDLGPDGSARLWKLSVSGIFTRPRLTSYVSWYMDQLRVKAGYTLAPQEPV